jgi:hypothetical protein
VKKKQAPAPPPPAPASNSTAQNLLPPDGFNQMIFSNDASAFGKLQSELFIQKNI